MGLDLNNRPEILLVLEWATVSLYEIAPDSATRAQPWGKADPDRPILLGLDADKVQLAERFEVSERRPSGWKFPIPRHLSRGHTISIDRLWIVRPSVFDPSAADDYIITPNKLMCMLITWQEPVNGKLEGDCYWKSRTYYGVTGPEYNLSSNAEAVSFTGEQAFTAMFYRNKSGKGTPPPVSNE